MLPDDTLPDPDAPLHGRSEVALVGTESQLRTNLNRCRNRRTQRAFDRFRVDHDAGVENALRVPDRLESCEEVEDARLVHMRQESTARPSVAVLTGEAATVLFDQVGSIGHEAGEPLHSKSP